MSYQLHPNVLNIPSGDRKRIKDVSQGKQGLVDLASGCPDLPMPAFITERVKASLDSGYAPYTNYFGLPELREKLSHYLKTEHDVDADPEKELLITSGVQEGLYIVMRAILLSGDEVIMPSPHYGEYYMNTIACGGQPVLVPLDEGGRFIPDIDRLEKAITRKTRALVFSNPNNPLGVVWPRGILEGIARLAERHNLIVLVDEVYHKFTYVEQPPSIGALAGMQERTFTFGGFSKAYMMMGMRMGYVVGPAELISSIKNLHYCVVLCPSYLGQVAALAALDCPKEQLEPMYREFGERLEILYRGVAAIPGVTCVRPRGGFYIFPNMSRFGMTSMELALTLIEKTKVVTLPGTEFGPYGEGYLRLSTCVNREQIEMGIAGLTEFAREFE